MRVGRGHQARKSRKSNGREDSEGGQDGMKPESSHWKEAMGQEVEGQVIYPQ